MNKTLFNLSDDILALEAGLEREDITDEQRDALIEAWLATQCDVTEKLDHYAGLIKERTAVANARRAAIAEMEALVKADQALVDRLKARMMDYFRTQGIERFDTRRYRIAIQGNGGTAPLVVPEAWEREPSAAPEAFHRHIIQLDREAIRGRIADFQEAAECVLKGIESTEGRAVAFVLWLERDPEAREIKESIEGCAIGERGHHLRIQ